MKSRLFFLFASLLIMETNGGWFEVIPDNGRPVEYFDTIHGIVAVKAKRFLVRTSTVSYEMVEEDGIASWLLHEIPPGEVLRTGMVFTDQKKAKLGSNVKNLLKKLLRTKHSQKEQYDMRYLQCYDRNDRELMLPLLMTGIFSPIGDPAERNYDAVYELHDLTLTFDLPLKAQLIQSEMHQKFHVPHGVLKLESLKTESCVLACRNSSKQSLFELPVDDELRFVRVAKTTPNTEAAFENMANDRSASSTSGSEAPDVKVDLPKRTPKDKKAKSPGFLERLGARKTKRERAALRALQVEGVFSSRLSRPEMNYEDFFENALDDYKTDGDEEEGSIEDKKKKRKKIRKTTSGKQEAPADKQTKNEPIECQYSKVHKRLQRRDLPPLPLESQDDSDTETVVDEDDVRSLSSNDTLYEHLPEAPCPPPINASGNEKENEEDGYMVPSHLLNNNFDGIMQNSMYSPHEAIRSWNRDNRRKNARNYVNYEPNQSSNNVGGKFDFTVSTSDLSRVSRDLVPFRRNSAIAGRRLSRSRQSINDFCRHAEFSIETDAERSASPMHSSRLSQFPGKSNIDPNLTIRSHNMRRLKSSLEVFDCRDSFHEFRPSSFCSEQPYCAGSRTLDPRYRIISNDSRLNSFCSQCGSKNFASGYSESEPGHRCYVRSMSVSGLETAYPKHRDDSAISLCSKGDYGFQGDSEFSYSEYGDFWKDESWTPPDHVADLSVQEVSKSLRYIGMKDRVVKRFANEQIDGQMLASLNLNLLKDGFPELNTFEVKKIFDFINGWRPKKTV